MAGMAWLICGASLLCAAVAQAVIPSHQRWGGAAWPSIASTIAIYLGLRFVARPRRRHLQRGVLGAITVVALVAIDVSHLSDFAVLPALWASAAGLVSLVALRAFPTAAASEVSSNESPTVDAMFGRSEHTASDQAQPRVGSSVAATSAPVPSTDACPYLGLANDRPTHFTFAVAGHRCYSGPKPRKIVLAHQESHCLTAHFRDCVLFPGTHSAEVEPDRATLDPALGSETDVVVVAAPVDVDPRRDAFVPAMANGGNKTPRRRFLPALIRLLAVALLFGLILAVAAWVTLPRAPG